MIEISIWGRGGQGAVSTGQLLAIAALYDRKHCQTFPTFGVERRGAPVQAFARIGTKPIHILSEVYNPDIVIVLDPTLMADNDVARGIKEGGAVIINSSRKPKEFKLDENLNVHSVDATSVAMSIFNMPIVNTPILGAFSAITGIVSIRSLQKAVDDKFAATKGKEIAELNKKAIKEVYDNTNEQAGSGSKSQKSSGSSK